jgi:hypothetical protein
MHQILTVTIMTGFPNTTGQYLPILWDPYNDPNMVILTVTTITAIMDDYHEHVQQMQQMTLLIPFDEAKPLVANAVTHNVENNEEFKVERVLDFNINMDTITAAGHSDERLLNAIYYDDDMDETKSLIRVQCRRCQSSCLVESYVVGECQCTWGPVERLEEDMQELNLEDNILGETTRSNRNMMTQRSCTLCTKTRQKKK